MKLEDQLCSLELAKRLKELGVKQESYFVWVENEIGTMVIPRNDLPPDDRDVYISAFSVPELGALIAPHRDKWHLTFKGLPEPVYDIHGNFQWAVYGYDYASLTMIFDEKTEADARAAMLIYLIEKGLVKP